MKTAVLIIGGVFSSLGIMFFAALEASNAVPQLEVLPNSAGGAKTAKATFLSTAQPELWDDYSTQN